MRAQMLGMALRGRSGGAAVSISNATYEEVAASGPVEAFFELQSDGDTRTQDGAGSGWLIGSTTGSNYECRATITSGSLSAGSDATGSWLALSSDRAWLVSRSSLGTKSCTFTLEIGLAGANTALDTASITLTATVESGA